MSFTKVPPKVGTPHFTQKMLAVLKSIIRRNPDGSLMDVYQLMDLHGNGATRTAMQYTLTHLRGHGLIEAGPVEHRTKSSGRPRRLLIATNAGVAFVRPNNLPKSARNP